jgi:hypothetical protein
MHKIILAIMLLPTLLFAQDSSATRPNSLQEGKWALEFGTTGLLNFTTYNSVDISFKRMCTDLSAWRIGGTIYANYTPGNYTSRLGQYALQFQYMRYTSNSDEILFYYGIGPILGYSYSENDDTYSSGHGQSYSAGLVGMVGVEWFATKAISANLEYRLSGIYTRIHNSAFEAGYPPGNYDYWDSGWSLTDRGISLGANIYFGK